jgi:Ser/Thr protein kinase RdoA (MazF antagonist)
MQGSLGEKIGEGLTSDVHAWAPGQVVKLFKVGLSPRFARHEMRTIRAAFAAGAPTPEVLGETDLGGRFGVVLTRYDGPSLAQKMQAGAVTYEEMAAILAGLYFSLHKLRPSTDVVSLRDWIAHASRQSRTTFPEHLAEGVLALLDRLPEGDALCHCDLHPGNVLITAEGPKIIDWVCAVRAPGIVDIGRCHVSLTELVSETMDPDVPRRINEAVQSEYARLAGVSRGELTAAMEPYLPILRALVFLQQRPATPAQRERLLQRIAAALLSEG